jgi:hypothetical protein
LDAAYAILRIGVLTIAAHFPLLGLRWTKETGSFPDECAAGQEGPGAVG